MLVFSFHCTNSCLVMLHKLLNHVLKLKRFSFVVPSKPIMAPAEEKNMSALKIVHAGGFVESYYTAIPAAKVMEKYPSFLLTKPEVFKRPWDAVVHPDKILAPGEKYYVVPRRTVKKLRWRMQKPSREVVSVKSFESQNSREDVSTGELSQKKSKTLEENLNFRNSVGDAKNAAKKFVGFTGIDVKQNVCQKYSNPRSHGGKRRVRSYISWQPSLTSIGEFLDNNE